MNKLTVEDLISLEKYARERADFRTRVLAHKRNRQLAVGPNCTWLFEDRLTIQYQVQEMLRAERIFEPDGIAEEVHAVLPGHDNVIGIGDCAVERELAAVGLAAEAE